MVISGGFEWTSSYRDQTARFQLMQCPVTGFLRLNPYDHVGGIVRQGEWFAPGIDVLEKQDL